MLAVAAYLLLQTAFAFALTVACLKLAARLRRSSLDWTSAVRLTAAMFILGAVTVPLTFLSEASPGSLSLFLSAVVTNIAGFLIPVAMVARRLDVRFRRAFGIVIIMVVLSVPLSLAATVLGRMFVYQVFKIPSGGMAPTLLVGDHIVVNKFVYRSKAPGRGDVVVFDYPEDREKTFIKRIVAVGGDVVEVRDKVLHLNGSRAADPHAHFQTDRISPKGARDNFGPFTVPPGHVFVMGDDRDHSHDSRFWGPVPTGDVRGRAFLRYWSWDQQKLAPRYDRVGTYID